MSAEHDPTPDETSPDYVAGAVHAQLEDLDARTALAVLASVTADIHARLGDRTAVTAHGILTVGALHDILAGVDPTLHVVADDAAGWWNNIAAVIVPATDPDYAQHVAVTLVTGDPFDSRQS